VLSRSRTSQPSSTQESDPIADLGDLLNDFSMTADICGALLSLFPATRGNLARMPRGERFQWLWSILGNDFVRDVLRDPGHVRQLRELIEHRVITNPRQLIYIDADVLADTEAVFAAYADNSPDAGTRIAGVLRRLLASRPASFSAIAAGLASTAGGDVLAGDGEDLLHAAAAANLGGPFSLSLLVHAGTDGVRLLAEAFRHAWAPLLQNAPVDVAGTAARVVEALAGSGLPRDLLERLGADHTSVLSEIVFHAFRPTNVGYRTVARWIQCLPDRTEDFARNRLVFGGAHWSASLGAYSFPASGAELRVVPSKNLLSYFAKASAGVCTGRDTELFSRPDHLHLNIVGADGYVTGTVQTHVITDHALRLMILRSINVSTTYLEVMPADRLIECVLAAATELAIASDIDELHIGESLGIWHMNSSRSEIRAVLEDLYDRLPRLVLERPLPLFTFAGFEIELSTTYRVWSTAEGTSSVPLFGRSS
jgi:hypothetical protein